MDTGNGRLPRMLIAGRTDVGQKRPHNEDSIQVNEEIGLFAVADGMGGHAAGEVASRAAIETLASFIVHADVERDFTWPFGFDKQYSMAENVLITAFQLANRKVCQLSSNNENYQGMGTTMAVLFIPHNVAYIAHVGDSRIYRLREDRMVQMTSDHSWVNEQVRRNVISEEEARKHRWRNVITRAMGNRAELEVDLLRADPQPGDVYLLCSDGLSGMVDDETMGRLIAESGDDMELASARLIDAANAAGGMDNISAILVKIAPAE